VLIVLYIYWDASLFLLSYAITESDKIPEPRSLILIFFFGHLYNAATYMWWDWFVAMGFSLQHPLIDLFFLFVFVSLQVRMAVFNQHHVDGLDLTVNPLLYMMRCYPVSSSIIFGYHRIWNLTWWIAKMNILNLYLTLNSNTNLTCLQGVPEQKLRAHLGSFGVSGNLALQPMYTLSGKHDTNLIGSFRWWNMLIVYDCQFWQIVKGSSACRILNYSILIKAIATSGGQKSRVAFAKITFKKPHIILLDEPSNHLVRKSWHIIFSFSLYFSRLVLNWNPSVLQDLDAVEALIQGLLVFQGGVLMVRRQRCLFQSV